MQCGLSRLLAAGTPLLTNVLVMFSNGARLRATQMPALPLPTGGDENACAPAAVDPGPHYLAHRMRLRERFLEAGAAALADYELLELVLFRAIPRRDLKPLAKSLLARFGSFAEVISAPRERLKEVKGLGREAARHRRA